MLGVIVVFRHLFLFCDDDLVVLWGGVGQKKVDDDCKKCWLSRSLSQDLYVSGFADVSVYCSRL
jgi:hypothetical protein